jgi:hypothetical protein
MKVLGAIGDHPAVSAVGWDVILSGLSLGLWAAARSLDVQGVLASSGLYYNTASLPKSVTEEIAEVAEQSTKAIEATPTPRRRRRTKKSSEETESSVSTTPATTSKRRGRPKKIVEADADKAYVPDEVVQEEGDEEGKDDWEVATLVWGLVAAGLGSGSAGVFGAETTAR